MNSNSNPQTLGTIVLQSPAGSDRLESLIETLVKQQAETNRLLSELASSKNPKEFIEHDEAASILGISRATLYNLCSTGKIPRYKSGSKNLFKRSDLIAWIEAQRVKPIERIVPPRS